MLKVLNEALTKLKDTFKKLITIATTKIYLYNNLREVQAYLIKKNR